VSGALPPLPYVLLTLILPLLCRTMDKQQIVNEKQTNTDVAGIIIRRRTSWIFNIPLFMDGSFVFSLSTVI
jgi:hypothetical protein